MVKAGEALVVLLALLGLGEKKEQVEDKPPPPKEDPPPKEEPVLPPPDEPPPACPPGTHRNEFGLCVPNVVQQTRDLFTTCTEPQQSSIEFGSLIEQDRNDSGYIRFIESNSPKCPNPNYVKPCPPGTHRNEFGLCVPNVRLKIPGEIIQPTECPPGTHKNEFGLCVPNIILTRTIEDPFDPLGFLRDYVD